MTWALVVLCWLLVNVAIFGALHISALHRELDDARRARWDAVARQHADGDRPPPGPAWFES